MVFFFQAFPAEFIQVLPGGIAVRNVVFRQFGHAKFDLYVTPGTDFLCIFQSLRCIREQCRHLCFGFDIILPALIAHTVFVLHFFSGLDTQQDIVGACIFRIGIMYIVGTYQFNPRLTAHTHQLLIDHLLLRDSMIL